MLFSAQCCTQGVLSKYISQLRTNTARYTDERVRLAGEAIAGSLAVKMLGQPPPASLDSQGMWAALCADAMLSLLMCICDWKAFDAQIMYKCKKLPESDNVRHDCKAGGCHAEQRSSSRSILYVKLHNHILRGGKPGTKHVVFPKLCLL